MTCGVLVAQLTLTQPDIVRFYTGLPNYRINMKIGSKGNKRNLEMLSTEILLEFSGRKRDASKVRKELAKRKI